MFVDGVNLGFIFLLEGRWLRGITGTNTQHLQDVLGTII